MRKIVESLFFALVSLIVPYQQLFAAAALDKPNQQQVQEAMRTVPLAFEQNGGAADTNARYFVHGFGMRAGFESDSISFLLPVEAHRATRLGMSFGGRSAQMVGEKELSAKTNYFRGNNPANWRTGLSNFAQIRYQQLWPGIDLVFYGNGELLEHDFVVETGAAPKQIAFDIDGAQKVELLPNGDLVIHIDGGEVNFKKPAAYQQINSERKHVAAGFRLNGNRVSFKLGRYDHRHSLTIDPVLVFSTLLAGSTFERIAGMAVDAQGNIYVTGDTFSTDFPTTAGSVQPACAGCSATTPNDAFVTKLNPTGTALVYSTFLGGTSFDFAESVGVDSNGNAIVAGVTGSPDFPAVNPISTFFGTGNSHLFISSLSPTGSTLNYSGVVGPLVPPFSFNTVAPAISLAAPLALDSSGNAYVTTQTLFSSFPTTPSAIAPVPPNPLDAVLVALKVSATGSLVYSTAIPGRATPAAGGSAQPGPNTFFQNAIAVDSTGSAYIAGQANDGLPTTLGVIGPAFVSDSGFAVSFPQEGFLLKLNPSGSALTYATYIPATSRVNTMRVDAGGNAYLGGGTSSPSLAISPNAFRTDTGCAGCQVGYLLKVNPQATATLGGTYLHGALALNNISAQVEHIALDANGNILVTGIDSGTMPTVNPLIQTSNNGTFIIQMSSDFSTLLFSSGGPDALIEIAPSGKIILATNNGFPATPGAFQTVAPPGRVGPFSLP
ncbi:MAG TPA: SBBP repeat-containing protein, partial [Candidatus Dormibacteraeota bacterium]|nr:SBBP repeat-containing protein [Candidatus Dormibacteraeota bacterium]